MSMFMKNPENSPGEFFVGQRCISCGACWKLTPEHFTSHPVHTYAFVEHQPNTEIERQACLAALKLCPVEAIICDITLP